MRVRISPTAPARRGTEVRPWPVRVRVPWRVRPTVTRITPRVRPWTLRSPRSGCRSPSASSCSGSGSGSRRPTSARVGKHPKAVLVALGCQLVLLPAICFGLVVLFDLPPLLGHRHDAAGGDPRAARRPTCSATSSAVTSRSTSRLTAINSVISVVTLPLITSLAINYYDRSDEVSMPFVEVVKVFVLVLVPGRASACWCGAGARASPRAWTGRCGSASAVILAVLVLGILLDERENVADYLADVGAGRRALLRHQPGGRVRRAEGAGRRRGPGDRLVDGDRRPQRRRWRSSSPSRSWTAPRSRSRRRSTRSSCSSSPRSGACSSAAGSARARPRATSA